MRGRGGKDGIKGVGGSLNMQDVGGGVINL